MQCSRCRQENPPQAKFCLECGSPLAFTCWKCERQLLPSSKFCFKCGEPVGRVATSESRFTAPDAYTPKHLAEKILTSKSALEGERKQVTVLFADLKGSMELLADRDPEEARNLLDPVLERMMEAVHRYEGTVNQVMGDGIMALFGAPLAHEDHAVRACYAALRMQDTVRHYSAELRRAQGLEVQIRVGLNSGDVVVRSIGSDLHMDYTAVGQTTHLAARMEQLAAPGSTRLTSGTLHLAEGFVQATPLGPVPVKGLGEPIEVFELTGAAGARTRLEAAARRGLTRFVGRTAEQEQLRDALDRASSGHGQVVAVVGEPGMGKSRLFWEFTHSYRVHGWLIVQSASVSYGKATAYLPVIELLRGYFEIESRDDPRKIREKVTGKVLTLAPALAPVVPALLSLLDVPVEEAAWHALDPLQRRRQTLDAVKRLLLRESEAEPLVVVFEDLHWIDSETQTLLDGLVDSLPAARLLLLVNYRPEYQHRWGGKTYYRQLRIDPLPPESADELLAALLGSDAALDPLKRVLVERTEANPLFLEESVRALAETGALAGERGAYRLTRSVEHLKIPATVQAILAARIDRLAPETKRLLQAAAVIGKDVPIPLLLAIADAPEDEVRADLDRLQAAEFLYETRLLPDLEYTFRHALTHEVAYQGLLHDRQRALHARITEAIERLSTDRVAEEVERLAHHAVRGQLWEKARNYLVRAGRRAQSRSAFRDAARWFEQALDSLRQLPESPEAQREAIDIRLWLRMAQAQAGDQAPILANLREAEVLARALGDERRLAKVSAAMATPLRILGDHERAIGYGQSAVAIADRLGDDPLRLSAGAALGASHVSAGNFRRAVEVLRPLVVQFGQSRQAGNLMAASDLVVARFSLTLSLNALGDSAEAITCAEEAVAVAEATDRPWHVMVAHFGLAVVRVQRGDFAQAIPLAERAVALAREWDIMDWLPQTLYALGLARLCSGEVEDGRRLLHQARDLHIAVRGTPYPNYPSDLVTAEGELLAGNVEEARSFVERALALGSERRTHRLQAPGLCLLGEVAAAHDTPQAEAAERHYRDAIRAADERGLRPVIARSHLGLGRLYARIGRTNEAREHFTTAATMYREMGMTYWLGQAERSPLE
jgi:class 3 adenylate cyclase/tetratricopeptide (TPR) repeat protein